MLARPLKDYALVAEIIGAAAVVVSLIYVGLSVNQNTNAIMVANHQALIAMDQDTNVWLRDPAFTAIFETAIENFDQLSPIQARQYRTFMADKFNAWEFAFITHNNQMMEDNIWIGWDRYYRWLLKLKGNQLWWNDEKEGYSPAFVSYVDAVLAETE